MKNDLVSVILPTYNRMNTITRAINSVLNQTYQNIELIIVDDHSTDGTFDLISELYGDDDRIIYIMNDENMGASKARNAGVLSAHGEIIAFHDSDDVWRPDKLEKQMTILNNSGDEVGMVYSQFLLHTIAGRLHIWPSDDIPMESKSGNILPYVLMVPLCGTPTMLIRKKYFLEMGGFSENIKSLIDYEFTIRFATKYHVLLCNEPLVDAYETEISVGKQSPEKTRVECLIMHIYRDKLEELGLKKEKMISVWNNAKMYDEINGIENIEDNIGLIISDKEYGQTFAVLEGMRLSNIFSESSLHIGIYLNDKGIAFSNSIRPERKEPEGDEITYELLLLIRYLAKNQNGIAVTAYHQNSTNLLPYDVKNVIVNDSFDVIKRCSEDHQDCIIFRPDTNQAKITIQNETIAQTVYTDKQLYDDCADTTMQEDAIYIEKLTSANHSNILETWENLLVSLLL